MKKICRWRWILTAVSVALLVSGCAGAGTSGEKTEDKKELKIGISVYDQYDTFVASVVSYLQTYAKEKENDWGITITLEIQNANNNQMTQNDQMDDFIERDFDITCINLVDRTDASTIIEKAKNANVPVIFFNRELVEEDLERWDKLYYVGADAFLSGEIQGEILVEECGKNFAAIDKNGDGVLQYVILEGEPGHNDSMVRTMSVIAKLNEGGIAVEKLSDEIANWNRGQAETKMNQWLSNYGELIEVVLANNDDMALGAIDALKKTGWDRWPVVLGIDGTDVGLKAVENKEMLGTVLNDSMGQAEGMLELAYSVTSGKELPEDIDLMDGKYIRLPYQKVTQENVDQVILDQKL
ncbi:MAG: galactose ABC transporter substrate-binding protein [Blautia sp.]|jgi:methyl-galactoside transport system substrate-binding protein